MRRVCILFVLAPALAFADPPAAPDPKVSNNPPQPLTRSPSPTPLLMFDVPPPPPPSLRLEALRIAGERADNDWRYPEPGPIFGWQEGAWFMGYGRYTPRNARAAALHGGSIAATFVGEMLLEAGVPIAGAAALLTGATLDAAAADVDRAEEQRHPTTR